MLLKLCYQHNAVSIIAKKCIFAGSKLKIMPRPVNPFFFKGDIPNDYFCDREAETDLLTRHIVNGHNVVLMSPRRIGKTGLINHCFQQDILKQQYYLFIVDILASSSLKEFTYTLGQELFDTLKPQSRKMIDTFVSTVRSISGELKYDMVSGLPKFSFSIGALQNPEYTLKEIFEYIDKADKPCVIAIDEFQQIAHYPEKNVEALLRTHIQHCNNAQFIFAGSERHLLTEMFNNASCPFFASSTMMNLDELEIEKYLDFLDLHFKEYNKNVVLEDAKSVYKLLKGNTFCLQKTFNVAFSMTAENATCDLNTMSQAIEDILLENEHTYKTRLSLLTPQPKEVLLAIAADGTAMRVTSGDFIRKHQLKSSSSVQSAIKQLLDGDWITHYSDDHNNKVYIITDPFLQLWLQK